MNELKKELKRLKKINPKGKYKIVYCKQAKENVIQYYIDNNWLCLHN